MHSSSDTKPYMMICRRVSARASVNSGSMCGHQATPLSAYKFN